MKAHLRTLARPSERDPPDRKVVAHGGMGIGAAQRFTH
jgi:hypothetical protein